MLVCCSLISVATAALGYVSDFGGKLFLGAALTG